MLFCEDVWGIIKEYAGIYHITTNWSKLNDIKIMRLYSYYRAHTGNIIKNITIKTEYEIRKIIFEYIYTKTDKDFMIRLFCHYLDNTDSNIGDEVSFGSGCGILLKKNIKSFTVKPYKLGNKENINNKKRKIYFNKNEYDKNIVVRNIKRAGTIGYNGDYIIRSVAFDDIINDD